MRYLASDVYALLEELACEYMEERYPHGEVWVAPGEQIFVLPDPDLIDGQKWFDADVLDHNLRDRWVGFRLPLPIPRCR
ncbi:hypothetical protein QR78_25685 [Methylobacterium indicum]|uniref:Uncharacterized protein n=1 Tax=Methylobacterium indicum TaxID=1775910 RepID=A0ABR5H7Q5_9HYPH|nr:hypothetical protein QR78_25685 [Methylobacterium indicum]KMO20520.1 hypothetical protein QR79_17925 [Methylobacterium indicum]